MSFFLNWHKRQLVIQRQHSSLKDSEWPSLRQNSSWSKFGQMPFTMPPVITQVPLGIKPVAEVGESTIITTEQRLLVLCMKVSCKTLSILRHRTHRQKLNASEASRAASGGVCCRATVVGTAPADLSGWATTSDAAAVVQPPKQRTPSFWRMSSQRDQPRSFQRRNVHRPAHPLSVSTWPESVERPAQTVLVPDQRKIQQLENSYTTKFKNYIQQLPWM